MRTLIVWLIICGTWLSAEDRPTRPRVKIEICVFEVDTLRYALSHPDLAKRLKALEPAAVDQIIDLRVPIDRAVTILEHSSFASEFGDTGDMDGGGEQLLEPSRIARLMGRRQASESNKRLHRHLSRFITRPVPNAPDRASANLLIEYSQRIVRPDGSPMGNELKLRFKRSFEVQLGETQIFELTPAEKSHRPGSWHRQYLRLRIDHGDDTPTTVMWPSATQARS